MQGGHEPGGFQLAGRAIGGARSWLKLVAQASSLRWLLKL